MTIVDFTGRAVILTGAAGGLGRSYAAEIGRRGGALLLVDVACAGEAPATAESVAAEIRAAGGRAVACIEDVTTARGGERIFQAAIAAFGRVDALINNAGNLRSGSFGELSEADRDAVWAVHLAGAFNVTRPVFGHMMEHGHGRILFTSSSAGLFGIADQAAYCTAKAGLAGLTRALAEEGASRDVLCNGLAPIAVTAMARDLSAGHSDMMRALTAPFATALTPDFVTPMAVFLASAACMVNGELFSAVGGRFARVVSGVTAGWLGPRGAPARAEDIVSHIGEIVDPESIAIPANLTDEFRIVAERIAAG